MARIRSLKPDMWQDEAIGEVSERARLIFIGLITQVDDEGRMKGSSGLVCSLLYPYHQIGPPEVSRALEELVGRGLIHWYVVGGRQFIELPSWSKHQRISHPTDSVLPSHSEADSESLQKIPEEPYREGKGRDRSKEKALSPSGDRAGKEKKPTDSRLVFGAWVDSTGKDATRTKLDPKRQRLIRDALKSYPIEDVIDAVKGWRYSPHHRGENERRTKYNGLNVLLRDAEQIEMFRDLTRSQAPHRPLTEQEMP